MSEGKNAKIIAEAREAHAEARATKDSTIAVPRMLLVAGHVTRLADALEAADARNAELERERESMCAPGDTGILTGEIRALAFEDGIERGPDCGDDECECFDHEGAVRPEGTYITIRMDGAPRVGLWRVHLAPADALAEHDRVIAEKAWDACYQRFNGPNPLPWVLADPPNPYRANPEPKEGK